MTTELIRCEDLSGAFWRLALVSHGDGREVVTLECLYSPVVTDWVHIQTVTREPKDIGLEWRSAGVTMINQRTALRVLHARMREHNAEPRPNGIFDGISNADTLPGASALAAAAATPNLEENLEGHRRVNLLEYLLGVEVRAAAATSGVWRAAEALGEHFVLGAAVTGAVTDPVAESMSPADLDHVLATQPLATGAMVRKLREAFYLLQDLAKAAMAARGEIDHLTAPAHRTEQYAQRIDMFDRWLASVRERCAAFCTIQVPNELHKTPLVSQQPTPPNGLTRDDLVKIARYEALRDGQRGAHDYLPRTPAAAKEFQPHEWVLWAMMATLEVAAIRARQAAP